MRFHGYTEKTYLYWIRKVIYFIDKRHPKDADKEEVSGFCRCLPMINFSPLTPKSLP